MSGEVVDGDTQAEFCLGSHRGVPLIPTSPTQSCEMSNLLHGTNLPNQILPQEKHVNRDKFSI